MTTFVNISSVPPSNTVEVLEHLHRMLDEHFQRLYGARQQMSPTAPVFALEHELGPVDLELLHSSVRSAVADGLRARYRMWWLPFVVYAAESGYDYVGGEYWWSFEQTTPGWRNDHRQWIKTWFEKFAAEYGGAKPQGAFAHNFTIIAWPITHAVLPTYLQRHLAQLLFEFRTGLTSALLREPEELGARLAARTRGHTERFRIFCENTALLGQVAAALLSGEDEETPYLVRPTLQRLVEGLSHERQSRAWLASARQSASHVRSMGFLPVVRHGVSEQQAGRLPTATDPKLRLRLQDGAWTMHVELPDLTVLSERLPHVYEELRVSRARIAGFERTLATGRLLYSGQEVQLTSWPGRSVPFIQLERGGDAVNHLVAEQCVVSPGPWWVFRRQGDGQAIEVKGKFVRPGHRYVLVSEEAEMPMDLQWLVPAQIRVAGVRAYHLDVPEVVNELDEARLVEAGLSLLSEVSVRPVGIVASSWDGEGAVEWLAGEPSLLSIRAERAPTKCLLSVNGDPYILNWPSEQTEMFLALDDLPVGSHEIAVSLLASNEQQIARGSLLAMIRDPQIRPESATAGEGIRLLASPARPTLSEIWDEGGAEVTIDGPQGTSAELVVRLRSEFGEVRSETRRSLVLPVAADAWRKLAKGIRNDHVFQVQYDDAESCTISVSKAGVGFATLTSERGYQPLRWRLERSRDGSYRAQLIDQTDGTEPHVEFHAVDKPLDAVACQAGLAVSVPPRGGMLTAASGEASASVILPTDPNRLLALGDLPPTVETRARTSHEVMRMVRAHDQWSRATLPGDPFALHQQNKALNAVATGLVSLIAGINWARLENRFQGAGDALDYLDEMAQCLGESHEQRSLGREIAVSLHKWLTPPTLLTGFAELMEPAIRRSGISGRPSAARFLLTLAGRPGYIADWNDSERNHLLECTLNSPVLIRAARFAVLGTRALNDADGREGGF